MHWRDHFRAEWLIPFFAVVVRLIPGPRTIDDAYITFRYVRNLLAGEGFVYNPGEAVLGTTTPFYSGVMALVSLPFGGADVNFPALAWLLNSVLAALTCFLLIKLGMELGRRNAGIATSLSWAVAPMAVTFDLGGMETGLVVALMTATFYFHLKNRTLAMAFLAAFSLLTRPDTLLYLAPLAVERIRLATRWSGEQARSEIRPRHIFVFAAPMMAWVIFSMYYFGSPLPNSIAAKSAAYELSAEAAFVRLLQHYATPFLGHLTFGPLWIAVGIFLFPILFVLGAIGSVRRMPKSWPIFIYPWIYLVAYSAANPLIFRWYLVPPLPILFLGIFMGVARIGEDLKFKSLLPVFSVVVLALTMRGWTIRPDHGAARPAPRMAFIKLEQLYESVGKQIQRELAETDVLAAGDIGALGYITNANILDTVGLVSPQVHRYYPLPAESYVINYAVPTNLILDQKPDWIVLLEVYGRNTIFRDPQFMAQYSLVDSIPTDIYGSEAMLIYQRIDTP